MARKVSLWSRLIGRAPAPGTEVMPTEPVDENAIVNPEDDTAVVPAPAPDDTPPPAEGSDDKKKKKKEEGEPTDDTPASDAAAPKISPVGEAHAATHSEPAPGSHAMFTALKSEFGVAFASQAVEGNLTMQEAVAARVEELTKANDLIVAENAALKKREHAYMGGEDAAVSASTDDPVKQAQDARAAELEKRGATAGHARLAAFIGRSMNQN